MQSIKKKKWIANKKSEKWGISQADFDRRYIGMWTAYRGESSGWGQGQVWELSPPLLASQCVSEQLTGPSTLWLDSDRYDPRRLQCGRGRGNETVSQWRDRRQAGESTCCPQLRGRVDARDRIDTTQLPAGEQTPALQQSRVHWWRMEVWVTAPSSYSWERRREAVTARTTFYIQRPETKYSNW